MLLRRIYQVSGWMFLALAAYSLIMALFTAFRAGNPVASLVLGLLVSGFCAALGFIILKFATGPAEAGIDVLGIEDKAIEEKAKSLVRKPQKVAAK
jgi:hypothetical protein